MENEKKWNCYVSVYTKKMFVKKLVDIFWMSALQARQQSISVKCSRLLEVQSSPKLKSLQSEHVFDALHAPSAFFAVSRLSQESPDDASAKAQACRNGATGAPVGVGVGPRLSWI